MATLVTRSTAQTDGTAAKGSELTHAEVDANFINLNDDKIEASSTDTLTNKSGNISQWTNDSGYITSYTETDTLDSVTGRGATTTNNVSVGQVTATNAVLEGTEDPILTLRSTDDGPLYMEFERGTDRHAYLGFGGSGDTFKIWNEESAGLIQFGTNNTEAIRIDENQDTTFYGRLELSNGGSFGVGTSTQHTTIFSGSSDGSSDDGTFALYGGRAYNQGAGVVLYGDDHATTPNVIKFTNGAFVERMRIDSSGDTTFTHNVEFQGGTSACAVGTNTSGSVAKLYLGTQISTTGFRGEFAFDRSTDVLTYSNGSNAAATRLTIDGTGNVGIGITAPSFPLDIRAPSGGGDAVLRVHNQFTGASDDAILRLSISGTTADSIIQFGDSGDNDVGRIAYHHNGDNMRFITGASEEMRLNNNGNLHVDGNVIAYSTAISDERLKDNVQDITGALDTVDALRGVTYTWNAGSREGKRDYGVIAQEVEQVIPEIVHDTTMPLLGDEETVYKTVDYEKLCAVLINAVSELRAEVEALKNGSS